MQNKAILHKISRLLYQETGVYIKEEKFFLIENRLSKRIRDLKLRHLADYYDLLQKGDKEMSYFISTMTTHKTSFFREYLHFELLTEWIRKDPHREWRIYCAACSSGEEVYSIAAHLEYLKKEFPNLSYKILGTDICEKSVQQATLANYQRDVSEFKKKEYLEYFDVSQNVIKPKSILKKHVKFRVMNLMSLTLPAGLEFDIIFLRNVLIYFDPDGVQQVVRNLANYHKKEGKLVIGLSEHISNHNYHSIGSSSYDKV